jgi:phage shock protein A
VGLFERTRHLAREIAEDNLKRLAGQGATTASDTKRLILDCEQLRRDLVIHRQEVKSREELARCRAEELARKADEWGGNAAFALARDNEELAQAASERSASLSREAAVALAEALSLAATVRHVSVEIEELDRRIEAERARRRGVAPPPARTPAPAWHEDPPAVARDPLEQAFEKLRGTPPPP